MSKSIESIELYPYLVWNGNKKWRPEGTGTCPMNYSGKSLMLQDCIKIFIQPEALFLKVKRSIFFTRYDKTRISPNEISSRSREEMSFFILKGSHYMMELGQLVPDTWIVRVSRCIFKIRKEERSGNVHTESGDCSPSHSLSTVHLWQCMWMVPLFAEWTSLWCCPLRLDSVGSCRLFELNAI